MCSDDGKHDANKDSGQVGKEHRGRTIPERIAEFVLYAIFVFGDVHFLWESHRILALVIAAAGFWCLLILDKGFSRRIITRWVAAASVFAVALYFLVPEPTVPEVEVTGTLLSGNERTPANSCDQFAATFPSNALRILAGGNVTVKTKPGKFAALQIGACPVLSMERAADNKINLEVTLYDAAGKLIVSTSGGQIRALTGENVRLRRNGDLSTLVIEDGHRNELLFLKYINPTTIRARGVFQCPNTHRAFAVTDTEIIDKARQGSISGDCTVDPAGPAIGLN